ncbi:MAG: nuclear transport factor 2 family protein [Alphaproteobacteria bacterium]|nr:nuclear transport factor 2 family protein [Alphaproteobacteria bacterium]
MTITSLTGTEKLRHASGLYLEGIGEGRVWEALNAHTGARYTQHSTGVGDGQQGFADFFEPFLARNPIRDIQVVRAIEDGPFVFLHVYQSLNNGESQWVTGDLFDTDEADRVIEHWDVIQAFETDPISGRSMIDGPADITDLEKTEENKTIVRAFWDDVLLGRNFDRAETYLSARAFEHHNPSHDNYGIDPFRAHHADLSRPATRMRYWKVHRLIGQGNFVVTLSHQQMDQNHYCCFDIYRLQNGMICEHWDVTEKIPCPEAWNNQGKF